MLALLIAGLFSAPVLAQDALEYPADDADAAKQAADHTTTTTTAKANARQQADAGSSSTNDPVTLDSLHVRAHREIPTGSASTRLPLTARETPQSLSSVSRKFIESRALTSMNGVLFNTLGIMTALYDPQRPLFYARGFKIEDFQIDGLPAYDQINQEFDTAFFERIDVVRGANGILTGVGVPSATINMIRKRPEREFGGSVTATLGRWDFYRLEADVNAPITADGSVRSRFVVAPQKEHGFHDRYSKEQLALMGIVEADLGSATTVALGYQRQNNQPKAPVWGTIPLLATDGGWINLPRSTSFAPSWTFWNRNIGTAFAEITHHLNEDWTLKASASRMEGTSDFLATYAYGADQLSPAFVDRSTGSGISVFPWRTRERVTRDSLDVYATGKLNLGGQQHDLTVGMNGYYTKGKSDSFDQASGGTYAIPNVYAWRGDMPLTEYLATGAHGDTITQQAGIFASARWRLGEQTSLLTGGRLTNWSTRQKNYDESGAQTGTSARLEVDHEFTPYIGLVHDLTPDVALYASYSRIFNPQNNRDRNNQVLDPAMGSNSEIGIKTRLNKDLNLNFAIYQTKQDNFAVLDDGVAPNSLPDGSSAYVGVDGTKAKGFELSADGSLFRNLGFVAGITYVKATRNESDLLYANFPEWLLQVAADYKFSGKLSPLTIGGGLNWQSKIEAFNVKRADGSTTTLTDGNRALVNLNATWAFNDDYSLTAAVTNLTDKRYWANLDYANYGEPCRYTLSFKAKF